MNPGTLIATGIPSYLLEAPKELLAGAKICDPDCMFRLFIATFFGLIALVLLVHLVRIIAPRNTYAHSFLEIQEFVPMPPTKPPRKETVDHD